MFVTSIVGNEDEEWSGLDALLLRATSRTGTPEALEELQRFVDPVEVSLRDRDEDWRAGAVVCGTAEEFADIHAKKVRQPREQANVDLDMATFHLAEMFPAHCNAFGKLFQTPAAKTSQVPDVAAHTELHVLELLSHSAWNYG
jgi:hypothetical protein